MRIPSVACCTAHVAPAKAFCDAFFCRDPVTVWIASRGFGGKTFLLGLLALAEAIVWETDVTVLGGSAQQSARVVERMHRFWAVAPHRYWLATEPGLSKTTLAWGNTIEALAASPNAVRGGHPTRLRLDEIDEMDLRILEAAQGQPMDRHGVRAQTVMSSTHQHPDGTMTEVLKRAAAMGWPVHRWCWRETVEPDGWLPSAQVERKRHEIPQHMWHTEYELQEPSAEGRAIDPEAVEWTFDPTLGTASPADLDHGWEGVGPVIDPSTSRIQNGVYYTHGADWGQAVDYTAIATLRCDQRPLSLVAAYRSRRRPWPTMIAKLSERIARYPGTAAHDHTGSGSVVGEHVVGSVIDVDMVGQRRRDLFLNYIAALEHHEIKAPRLEPFYSEHRYCRVEDLFGSGHPPDTVVACALAYYAFRNRRAPGDYGITI